MSEQRHWLGDFIAKFWSHIFVISTGFAALVHSTWTLSTLFGGVEPSQISQAWLPWVVPGFAIAFSFDVGQIAISVDLRRGERTWPKYISFCICAAATYYLQWLYMAAHVPHVPFGTGVALADIPAATSLRDFAVWLVPAMLPLATTLYTFSYAKPKRATGKAQSASAVPTPATYQANRFQNMQKLLAQDSQKIAALPAPDLEARFVFVCPDCGWKNTYESERGMINGRNAHQRRCPAKVEAKDD